MLTIKLRWHPRPDPAHATYRTVQVFTGVYGQTLSLSGRSACTCCGAGRWVIANF